MSDAASPVPAAEDAVVRGLPVDTGVVAAMHPADVADALARLDADAAAALVARLGPLIADAVWELDGEVRRRVLAAVDDEVVCGLVEALPDDGGADLVGDLDDERVLAVLRDLEPAQAQRLERLLRYGPETAGALMTTDVVVADARLHVDGVLELLRGRPPGDFVYYVYVLDAGDRLVGVASLREIVLAPPTTPVGAIATTDVLAVQPTSDREVAARLAARYDLLAVPVVSADGRLLGVVTGDDVLEVLSEEADEDIERFAGSADAVGGAGLVRQVLRRVPWTAATLGVEVCAGWVLLRPLRDSAALLVFVPLVLLCSSSAAIAAAGSALRRLSAGGGTTPRALARDGQAALLLGAIGSCLTAVALLLAGRSGGFAGVVSWAVGVSVAAGAVVGSALPVVLRSAGRDAALASGPLIGVAADVAALAVFVAAVRTAL